MVAGHHSTRSRQQAEYLKSVFNPLADILHLPSHLHACCLLPGICNEYCR